MRFSSPIKKIITLFIVLLVIYFFGQFVLKNLTKISWREIKIRPDYLILSILVYFISFLSGGYAWVKNLSTLGEKINFWQGLKVIALSQFGKYIPGKIWSVGGRVILSKRLGIDEVQSSLSVLIEAVCLFLAATTIFLFSLSFYGKETVPQRVYLFFLFIPLSLIFLHPRILKKLLAIGNWLKMKIQGSTINRQPLSADLKLSVMQIFNLYLLYLLSWLIHSTVFFFLSKALYPATYNYFGIIGAFSFSWALSFAVVIIPGGLGIREGILTFFLKFFLPLPIAALLSLIGRLWTTFGEIITLIISFLIKGRKNA